MKRLAWMRAPALGVLLLANTAAWAADASSVPPAKQTKANLYLNSEEVMPFLEANKGRALFVDIRTPAELLFAGSTPLIDANVPFKLGPVLVQAGNGPVLAFEINPDFARGVESRLTAKSLSKSDPVIVMCRAGERSASAANLLTEAGFTQVYLVVDGFEGDIARDGPNAGHRTVNGWKNKGLPWGYDLDTGKVTVAGPAH